MRTRFPRWFPLRHRTVAAAGLIVLLLALQACGGSAGTYKNYGGSSGGGVNSSARFTGKIIFVKDRNIFVLDGKTNSVTPLTTGNDSLQPALSPDGKTLALEIRQPGNFYSDIATMPLAGGSPTLHTSNALFCHCDPDTSGVFHYEFWAANPIWTGDGQNLIYLSDFFKGGRTTNPYNQTCQDQAKTDYIQDLGIVEIAANAQPTPAVAANKNTNSPTQLAWPYCYAGGDQNLSLRPGVSDTEILFTSFQYIPPQQSQLGAQLSLLIIPNDGSPERIIQLSPLDPNAVPLEPSWSPDGKYITYVRRENGQDNLYIMSIPDTNITGTPNDESYLLNGGGTTTYYTNTSYYDASQKLANGTYGNPIWSPDGKNLVFLKFDTADNGGAFDLFLAKLTFATPAAGPTAHPTGTATATLAAATISIDGAQVPLTQGGVDGESTPIWVQ